MPTIALSTGSLYTYGLARVFELAAQAGFDAVEVLADQRWDSRHPAYLQRLSQETGLPIAAIHCPFIVVRTAGWPSDPVSRLRVSATLAKQLGAPVIVAHLPLRFRLARIELLGPGGRSILLPLPGSAERGYLDFLVNGLAQFEAAEGVCVGVENMPVKRVLGRQVNPFYLNDPEGLSTLPHLTLDTTHVGTWGMDLLEVYERLKASIVHVHLSNFNGREHRLLEDGHLPLRQLLRSLSRDGFGGTVTVELDPESLQAEDERQVQTHLRRVIEFCRENAVA
jgi:sugar phosphate isomerase/epimerase